MMELAREIDDHGAPGARVDANRRRYSCRELEDHRDEEEQHELELAVNAPRRRACDELEWHALNLRPWHVGMRPGSSPYAGETRVRSGFGRENLKPGRSRKVPRRTPPGDRR